MTPLRAEMEARRLSAIEDLRQPPRARLYLARKYGVSRATISRWRRQLSQGGLRAHVATGRQRRVSREVLATVWQPGMTAGEFRDAVKKRLNVTYHADHLSRLLLSMGLRERRPKRVSPAELREAR